jgi:HEPN domain-containing protein
MKEKFFMKLPEIALEWLQKAEEDYGFACVSIEGTDFFSQICFHFQQAAEKYLKTFIVANRLDFRAVHNLLELLEICKQKDPCIKDLEQACRFLNPFYIDTRYPVHWPVQYNQNIAKQAKEMTEKIGNWVKKSLEI